MVRSAILDRPLTLPCGAVLPNRIAKAAMSEHLAAARQSPSDGLTRLYGEWSKSGAGLLITGNVMVDPTHLESNLNVAIRPELDADAFRRWAQAGTASGNHLWMQLNHPGRQTPASIHPEPSAPSAGEAVDLFKRAGAFAPPRAMSPEEVDACINAFARAAALSDLGNAIAALAPRKGPQASYINPDTTLYLEREPLSDWIALDLDGLSETEGVGLANVALHDTRGPIGRVLSARIFNPVAR